MSEPSTLPLFNETELPRTSSAAASPAKTLATMKVSDLVSGRNTRASLATFDPSDSSWRTSQACLVSGWEEFSETWPRSGMMLSGIVYPLDPSAPHIRDRVWLFAYPQHPNADDARSYRAALHIDGSTEFRDEQERQSGSLGAYVADASGARRTNNQRRGKTPGRDGYRTADCDRGASRTSFGWRTEPDVGRVAYGVPSRVDRLRSLGNAVVPQVVEVIGRAILQAEHGA